VPGVRRDRSTEAGVGRRRDNRQVSAIRLASLSGEKQVPAKIVVVHDDPDFLAGTVTALRTAGYEVALFTDSMSATHALRDARLIEVLITRIRFPEGTPHGLTLARSALLKYPGLKVLFVAAPATQDFAVGIGEFLSMSVKPAKVVRTVDRMLAG
jgi:DNA-binding NtrC family response regulator